MTDGVVGRAGSRAGGRSRPGRAGGGGVSTARQFLQAGLIDEMHLAVSPELLGSGENLFAGLDLPAPGYQRTEHVSSPHATPVVFTRRAPSSRDN